MARSWKKSDITYLRHYGEKRSVAELARHFRAEEAEVKAKLAELRIPVRGASAPSAQAGDALLGVYEQALAALHSRRWAEAQELFGQVAAGADQPDLAARGRSYLEVCRRERATAEAPADPYLEAVFLRNAGRVAEALERCRAADRRQDERFAYLAAGLLAAAGDLDAATTELARAVRLDPHNAGRARHDPDFEPLRRAGRLADALGR